MGRAGDDGRARRPETGGHDLPAQGAPDRRRRSRRRGGRGPLRRGPAPAASAGTQADAAGRASATASRPSSTVPCVRPRRRFPATALHVRLADGTGRGPAPPARRACGPARRMRPNDRIRAGSILKPLVAAATLQLVEDGRFGLDDPLPAVLPADVPARFPEADRITVRMLLDHTSGLAEYSDPGFDRLVAANPLRVWNTSELLDRTAGNAAGGRAGRALLLLQRELQPPRPGDRAGDGEALADGRPRARHRAPAPPAHVAAPARARAARPRHRPRVRGRERQAPRRQRRRLLHGRRRRRHAMLSTTGDLSRFLRGLLAGKLFERPLDPGRDAQLRAGRRRTRAASATASAWSGTSCRAASSSWGTPAGTAGYLTLMEHLPAQDIDISMATITPARTAFRCWCRRSRCCSPRRPDDDGRTAAVSALRWRRRLVAARASGRPTPAPPGAHGAWAGSGRAPGRRWRSGRPSTGRGRGGRASAGRPWVTSTWMRDCVFAYSQRLSEEAMMSGRSSPPRPPRAR